MYSRVLSLVLGGLLLWAPSTVGQSRPESQRWGVQMDGRPLPQLAASGERAVVLFFVATDCPISNRTFPELERLRKEFAPQGIRFWFVYPNTYERASEIVAHQKTYAGHGEALQDPDGKLTRLSHAVATPEMIVLRPEGEGWRPVYAGRVDDRFVHLGVERPVVTRHFGEDALKAVIMGKSPEAPVGAPVGCAILNPGVR